ncbi:hypothetical protein Egran_01720, partial [Elaphomyces granulatus]
MVEYSECL